MNNNFVQDYYLYYILMTTVENFLAQNSGWTTATINGVQHLVLAVSGPCKKLKYITYLVNADNTVGDKIVQSLEDAKLEDVDKCSCCCYNKQCYGGDPSLWCPNGVASAGYTCFDSSHACAASGPGPAPGPAPGPGPSESSFIISQKLRKIIKDASSSPMTKPEDTKVTTYFLLLKEGSGSESISIIDDNYNFRKGGSIYHLAKYLSQPDVTSKQTLPIDRMVIGFFRPDLNYVELKDKKSLRITNDEGGDALGIATTEVLGKTAYIELQNLIIILHKFNGPGGKPVQVYLSMGGWNYNCHPELYLNSFDSDNQPSNPGPENEWGYKCEPKGAMGVCISGEECPAITSKAYSFFYDPDCYEAYNGAGDYANASNIYRLSIATAPGVQKVPEFPPDGSNNLYITKSDLDWTYPKWKAGDSGTKAQLTHEIGVKCEKCFQDPYTVVYKGFVEMAAQLNADGVDFDYEEFWHGDTFKSIKTGIFKDSGDLLLTKHKFARCTAAFKAAVNTVKTTNGKRLGLSVPSGVVGMWQGAWWFGNLKGLMLGGLTSDGCTVTSNPYKVTCTTDAVVPKKAEPYKTLFSLFNNAGSWNDIYDSIMPMTYDMGGGDGRTVDSIKGTTECSMNDTSGLPKCDLASQVQFYIDNGYTKFGVKVHAGFEIGRPAFPHAIDDGNTFNDYQLPLDNKAATTLTKYIKDNKDKLIAGGFYWELFKDIITWTDYDTLKKCVADGSGGGGGNYADLISANEIATLLCKSIYGESESACSWNIKEANIGNYKTDSKSYWGPDGHKQAQLSNQNQTASINTLYNNPASYGYGPMPNYNNCTCLFSPSGDIGTCLNPYASTFPGAT